MSVPLPMVAGQLVFENSAGRIFHPQPQYIQIEWLPGAAQVPAHQRVFEQALHIMQRTGTHRILSDQRMMPLTSPAAQSWVATDWLPRAVREAGYARCAVLLSENVFARLAAVTWHSQNQPLSVTYQAFATLAEAAHWLTTE